MQYFVDHNCFPVFLFPYHAAAAAKRTITTSIVEIQGNKNSC